jgi:hypothetical protein
MYSNFIFNYIKTERQKNDNEKGKRHSFWIFQGLVFLSQHARTDEELGLMLTPGLCSLSGMVHRIAHVI